MRRDKAEHTSALPVYQVDLRTQHSIMTGTKTMKDLFKTINGSGVAEADQYRYGNKNINGPDLINFYDMINKEEVEWYPGEFIAYPVHQEIKNIIMHPVEEQQQFFIPVYQLLDQGYFRI
jgi:hypothetical protein